MIAAANASDTATRVAFNRRYAPLVRELKRLLTRMFQPSEIQHVRYDLTRVGRTDVDFSWTAIHGIDTARFIASSDYRHIRFHYQEFSDLGPKTANIFMDCTFTSGATAHLDFCPVAGVVVERATVYAYDNTFFLNVPVWSAFDSPGLLRHFKQGKLEQDIIGTDVCDGCEAPELEGFYAENASFFDALREGRHPTGNLRDARQSVEIAQCIGERRSEYHLSSPGE